MQGMEPSTRSPRQYQDSRGECNAEEFDTKRLLGSTA